MVDAIKITCDMTQTFRVRSMSMGIKRILLKLVDDIPEDTLPTSPKRTGSISGFLHTQLGLHLCWTTELKYQWVLINLLENCLWLLSFMLNLFQYLILSYIDKLKYKSFNSGLLSFINFNFSLYANFLIVFLF
jgi:hypothetical protein